MVSLPRARVVSERKGMSTRCVVPRWAAAARGARFECDEEVREPKSVAATNVRPAASAHAKTRAHAGRV
jgi:hypothetical protein